MKGYWNRPEETAAEIRDGWLHTGEIGRCIATRTFRIVDRLKDMIIRSGMISHPAEVEAVLARTSQGDGGSGDWHPR